MRTRGSCGPASIRTWALILIAAAVHYSGAAPHASASIKMNGMSESTEPFAGLHDRWIELMKAMRIPGMAVVVVKGDEVIFQDTLGVRDPRKNLPVTPDTMFYIASCTKSYLAMAIMQLADAGKLELDAPVRNYIPRFAIADTELTQTISVRDLLSHAKGLNSGPIVWLDAYTGEITEERYFHWLAKAKAKNSLEYTNVHYTLLGRILESITGKSWKEALRKEVFNPAGMTRTTCVGLYADNNVASPCVDGKPATVRKTDRTMHAAGGMGTSIQDLARMLRVQLNGGLIGGKRLLSLQSLEQMHTMQESGRMPTPRVPGLSRDGYGLGWFIGKYKGKTYIDHGGGYVGSRAIVSFIPEDNLGVAVIANDGSALPVVVALDIYDRLLGLDGRDMLTVLKQQANRSPARADDNPAMESNPARNRGLSQPASAYVGEYHNEHWGTIHVRYTNGLIVGSMGDLTLRFESKGVDRFLVSYGTGQPDEGRFEIGKRNKASGIVLVSDDFEGEARFARR